MRRAHLSIVAVVLTVIVVISAASLIGQDSASVKDRAAPSQVQQPNAKLADLRREGLTKILRGMRAHGARPEQIANVERELASLPG